MVPEGGVVPVVPQFGALVDSRPQGIQTVARSGGIRSQVGTAAVPCAIGEDVRIGKSYRAAAATSPKGVACSGLLWSWHHSK